MPNYRRVCIKGSTVFITMVTLNRHHLFLEAPARAVLRRAWNTTVDRFPFTADAICLLPDHLHALITLPEDDDDYSLRIREIKRLFTRHYLAKFGEKGIRNTSRQSKQEAAIWQRRFWEHTIRDERDYQNHFDYIHFNPVKHGLVEQVSSWQWSSFHRYVRLGVYTPDWGLGYKPKDQHQDFGE